MKLRADTLLIKLQLMLLTGIVLTQTLGQPAVSSILFTLTFVVTACLWFVKPGKVLALLIVMASCISVAVNALVTNTIVSFSYFKKLIMFGAAVLFFASMSEYRPEKTAVDFIFRWNTALALFLAGMYLVQNGKMHLLNNRITVYLTFRFTNPNLTAVFLSAICILEVLCLFASQKRGTRILHAVLAIIMARFVFETRARNAQLLLLLFLTACLLMKLFPRRRWRMTGWSAALIAVLPLLFAAAYLPCIRIPGIRALFAFVAGEGKPLDGRVKIWTFALQNFASSPVFGAYSQISGSTGQSQLHNSHLDVLASYGAVVLVMLCLFLYRTLRSPHSGQENVLCLTGFAALLLSGIGEATLFSGGLGIYIFAGAVRMLANFDFAHRELPYENRIFQ